jgi:hypothetical protein
MLNAIHNLLFSWPALKLVVENEDNSEDTIKKIKNLSEELDNYFNEYGDRIEPEDIEIFLDTFFMDVFGMGIEDDSVFDISKCLVKLYRDVSNNNFAYRDSLLALNVPNPFEENSSFAYISEEEETCVLMEVCEEKVIEKDPDGWTVVQKKNKKK